MSQVIVILGSTSDREVFEKSGFCSVLDEVGITYEVSIISAHRNPDELEQYCRATDLDDTLVFVGVAGMAAALPGAIAALVASRPVIGVPLPSEGYPNAQDAFLAMYRMPPGKPVAVCGLANLAPLVCQIVALRDEEIFDSWTTYLAEHRREPQLRILSSDLRKE